MNEWVSYARSESAREKGSFKYDLETWKVFQLWTSTMCNALRNYVERISVETCDVMLYLTAQDWGGFVKCFSNSRIDRKWALENQIFQCFPFRLSLWDKRYGLRSERLAQIRRVPWQKQKTLPKILAVYLRSYYPGLEGALLYGSLCATRLWNIMYSMWIRWVCPKVLFGARYILKLKSVEHRIWRKSLIYRFSMKNSSMYCMESRCDIIHTLY